MSHELKIKHLTLGAEAKIIKTEEQRELAFARKIKAATAGELDKTYQGFADSHMRKFQSLQDHRKQVVRPEARATHLVRAFFKGTPYKRVENKTREGNELVKMLGNTPQVSELLKRVIAIAKLTHPNGSENKLMTWVMAE